MSKTIWDTIGNLEMLKNRYYIAKKLPRGIFKTYMRFEVTQYFDTREIAQAKMEALNKE